MIYNVAEVRTVLSMAVLIFRTNKYTVIYGVLLEPLIKHKYGNTYRKGFNQDTLTHMWHPSKNVNKYII